jgi:hypothetical protein
MKTVFSIFFLFSFQNSFSQFNNNDSLITNPVAVNQYMFTIKNIDSRISKLDSITHAVNNDFKWKYICSYKKGWQTVIGSNGSSSGVKIHRTDFNDIRVLKKGNDIFTTSELKKLFYLNDSRFIKDSVGNVINGPMVMTKNNKFLIISLGGYYPNGNQTSWEYRMIYYFTKEQNPLVD